MFVLCTVLHWVGDSENSFKDHSVRLNEHRVLYGWNSGSTLGGSEDCAGMPAKV